MKGIGVQPGRICSWNVIADVPVHELCAGFVKNRRVTHNDGHKATPTRMSICI